MTPELVTQWDGYADRPDLYVCSEPETTDPTVACVLDAMPTSGRVLDLGCGQGRVAVPVAEARPGLQVTGVDVSPRMLDHAATHPRVEYVLGDGATVPGPVDGVWSVLLFQHLPPDAVAGYLTAVHEQLTVGGPLLVQFVAGDYHLGLDHRYWPSTMAALAEGAGFVEVSVRPDGLMPEWWWLHAHAAESR